MVSRVSIRFDVALFLIIEQNSLHVSVVKDIFDLSRAFQANEHGCDYWTYRSLAFLVNLKIRKKNSGAVTYHFHF